MDLLDFEGQYKCAETDRGLKLGDGTLVKTLSIELRRDAQFNYYRITPAASGGASSLKLIGRELTILGETSDKDISLLYTVHDGKVASITYYDIKFSRIRKPHEFAHSTNRRAIYYDQ